MTIAHPAHPPTRELRALRLHEERGHEITRIAPDVYRVPSQDGQRSYDVVYGEREECPCPDYQYGGGRPCKHLLCIGILHAARRSGVREVRTVAVAAGDGIQYRAKTRGCPGGCPACFGGYVTITVEEDGAERDEAVPCRRCQLRSDSR